MTERDSLQSLALPQRRSDEITNHYDCTHRMMFEGYESESSQIKPAADRQLPKVNAADRRDKL